MGNFRFCPKCGKNIPRIGSWGFKCKGCSLVHYFNSIPAVAIIPIFKDEIMVSIRGIEPRKGMMDVIGGFLDNGEDPLRGGVREFFEETGLKVPGKKFKFFDFMVSEYIYSGGPMRVLNIIYTIKFDKKITPKGRDDVEKLLWININGRYNFAFRFINKLVEQLR